MCGRPRPKKIRFSARRKKKKVYIIYLHCICIIIIFIQLFYNWVQIMARFTPILGDLSGKVGDCVFAKNKSGAYLRRKSTVTSPASEAQVNNRSRFAMASQLWAWITEENKTLWASYAQNSFQPARGTNSGQYSGFQAFASTRQLLMAANAKTLTMDILNDEDEVCNSAPRVVAPVYSPPSSQIVASFKTVDMINPVFPVVTDAVLNVSGESLITISLSSALVASTGNAVLQDGNGNDVGFAVFISNGLKYPSQFVVNPESICLGYSGFYDYNVLNLNGATELKLDITAPAWINQFKSYPTYGDYARVTVYIYNPFGIMQRIGSVTVAMTPLP